MHPALQISILVLYVLDPNNTSGGRYQSVTTSLLNVFTGTPKARASPKSPILSSPRLLMRRFWGLRSRWRTRLSWQYAMPCRGCKLGLVMKKVGRGGKGRTLRSWYMNDLTISGCNAPFSPFVSMYFLRSCSQNWQRGSTKALKSEDGNVPRIRESDGIQCAGHHAVERCWDASTLLEYISGQSQSNHKQTGSPFIRLISRIAVDGVPSSGSR
jgi:hypothetical protein